MLSLRMQKAFLQNSGTVHCTYTVWGYSKPMVINNCYLLISLLSLGISLLKGTLIVGSVERTLLRERIYNAALDFFWLEASQHFPEHCSVNIISCTHTHTHIHLTHFKKIALCTSHSSHHTSHLNSYDPVWPTQDTAVRPILETLIKWGEGSFWS